jgi:hypothetical protein
MQVEVAQEISHGGNRPVYVMLPLRSEDKWKLHKECARDSGLKGAEVIAEVVPLTGGEMLVQGTGMTEEVIVDPIVLEQLSQDECHNVTHRVSLGREMAKSHLEFRNLVLANNEFDVNILDNEPSNEENIDEDDEASSSENKEESNEALVGTSVEGNDSLVPQNGDEDDEASSSDDKEKGNEALIGTCVEGNDSLVIHSLVPQNVGEDDEVASTNNEEETNDTPFDIGGEGNDSFVPGSHIDLTLYYTEEELRALKLKHIKLHEVPNHKDKSGIDSTVCNNALVFEEGNPRVMDEVIKKGQLLESLKVMKFFL